MRLVTDYLDDTARRFPDKICIADNSGGMTFRQLREAALHIASYMIHHHPRFKSPVCFYLDKSAMCIAAMMGIAYSGNFYIPLDTKMPEERIRKILHTLGEPLVITDRAHKNSAEKFAEGLPVCCVEDAMAESYNADIVEAVTNRVVDTDVLYVLFTSGSTGNPKGVVVSHKAVMAYADWVTEAFGINEDTIFGNQTPFYFSMSVLDIFQTLKNGCTLYIIPKILFAFPIKLLEFISQYHINTIYWVPSALCLVANLRALGRRDISCLKKVLFAGETMPAKQLNEWMDALPDALFANLFGPTETTDICDYFIINRRISNEESVPIGGSCRNTDTIVLNEQNEQVTGEEIGELCVRGSILAYGYYNNPEKTRKVFVQNPLNHAYPEIIYRTGDLVHYNPAGELLYNGRKDFQIKHMGRRIELGEIETAASSVEGVLQNCCLYNTQEKKIVLFYTGKLDENGLVQALQKLLPPYMIPGQIERLRNMPFNLNGKIDRAALKEKL